MIPRPTARRARAFTLVELLIGFGLLPMLLAAIYLLWTNVGAAARSEDAAARLNHQAMQVLRTLNRELSETGVDAAHFSLTTDADNNQVLTFQIPVDWDGDGDVVDDGDVSAPVEWGAYDQPGQLDAGQLDTWARYSVVDGQLLREVLDANQAPIDGLERVVLDGVNTMTAVQQSDRLTVSLGLEAVDEVGQHGQARTHNLSVSHEIILRTTAD